MQCMFGFSVKVYFLIGIIFNYNFWVYDNAHTSLNALQLRKKIGLFNSVIIVKNVITLFCSSTYNVIGQIQC